MSRNPERPLFKDWFDREAASRLADRIGAVEPSFKRNAFVRLAARDLSSLEFHGRIRQFSDALRVTLPDSVPDSLAVLTRSLPTPLPDCETVTDGWLLWPVGQYIADHGPGHFEPAFEAMVELTKRFTAEFAVRPFVESDAKLLFPRLLELTDDSNPHVRRWCSEGVRTRLPWGRKLHDLIADPSPVWPILEALKDDTKRYVQKSVANNLNDLAKDHPDLVVERCRRWMEDPPPQRKWTVRHALRTLVKDGHPEALALLGWGPPENLTATLDLEPAEIRMGESVALTAKIATRSPRPQSLVLDYAIHFVRMGGRTSRKVFKWTRFELDASGGATFEKRHLFKPATVRALYPGLHRIELQVNGRNVAHGAVLLKP